ncbi:MAG TPA: class I SAM-dependent methyltransferase [Amycolatopsis sp.]
MTETDAVAERRPAYLSELADGTERFFEERRETCAWCDSKRLEVRLRTTDLLQHKPGKFVLESCQDCGHIFQNPRLTGEGLGFYYRDCYDGLGEKNMNSMFEGNRAGYAGRARLVASICTPGQWLDVGTGHGHFPRDAKEVLPDTEFDGLDMTDGVELAQQDNRIRRAYRGNFVDLAEELSGRYDVISMYHYLEHTPEPKKELAAAAVALPPGGHLAIELPDPESRWGRLLGRWWLPWLQPQHLNLIPIGNLRDELAELGFTVVAEQRAEPHSAMDLVAAVMLTVNAATIGGEDLAWRRNRPSRTRALLRKLGFIVCIPVFVIAGIVDRISAPIGRKRGMSNAYRVVARKKP